MSGGGRPPEEVGPDHYKPAEAAKILDVSTETVKRWVGTRLVGDSFHTEKGEKRWRVTKESVHQEAQRRRRLATNADLEHNLSTVSHETKHEVIETIRRIFAESDERLMTALVKESDRHIEADEQELELLRENLEVQKQILEKLERIREEEIERRCQGLRERRSFWRRLFVPD